MTVNYTIAVERLHEYDKARHALRVAEQELKDALREYSIEQRYSYYIGIDTFRATVATREEEAA